VYADGLGVGGAGACPGASTEGEVASLAWGAASPSPKSTRQLDVAPDFLLMFIVSVFKDFWATFLWPEAGAVLPIGAGAAWRFQACTWTACCGASEMSEGRKERMNRMSLL
jgi:hypothetical protein